MQRKTQEKKDFKFYSVSIDEEVVQSQIGKSFRGAKIVDSAPQLSLNRKSKRHLHISKKSGEAMHLCASLNPEYICCRTHVLRNMSNCPFNCTYCFLGSYLNNGTTMVVGDIDALIQEVKIKIEAEPWRFFRIGTWELSDSLALEKQLGAASEMIKAFSGFHNAVLEHKTKGDVVEPILNLNHHGRTIISWSLNPQNVIDIEERGTANLERRLLAMEKVVSAGYLTAIHFDPMIVHEGWEQGYENLTKKIFEIIDPKRVAWISIGALRFNPEMKKKIEADFPSSKITSAEMVLGPDGKTRYVKPIRIEMFSHLLKAVRKYAGPDPFVYLCMERWDVWERILGYAPRSIGHLDYLITKSLHERFPGLVHEVPQLELYEECVEYA
ncbi:MAG: hypothetical protein GY847_19310 [Proteobacteria bacterium]|nr:hypothetical protein [Pseudomonadota bacterium]